MKLDEIRVVKIRPGDKRPAGTNWQNESVPYAQAQASDPDNKRWGMVHGEPNWTWVLDVDAKNGKEGLRNLAELEEVHGPLPRTPRVYTQNDGVHYIFRWDPERPVITRQGCPAAGIDTRGRGGQSLIPPTPGYRWEDADLEPAFAPDWLMDAVAGPAAVVEAADRPAWMWSDEEGARAEARRYPVARQGEGGHTTLFKLAQVLVKGWGLSPELAEDVLWEEWNPRCDPPWESGGKDASDFRRACQRAHLGTQVPWGARFYGQGVTLRAIKAYGPAGQVDSVVPYRVWPDGRMLKLSFPGGVVQAIRQLATEQGAPPLPLGEAKKLAEWWKHEQVPEAEMPQGIVVDDAPGPSLARIVLEPGETPAWDEFLARLTCPQTFLAWLWMLTLSRATRQILWIRGDGHDGKTSVCQVLYEFLGEAAMAVTDEYLTGAERWFPAAIYGKRLVMLEDTKKRAAARTGPIHRAVGGSPMAMEQKGMPPFTFIPNVALLVTSNARPEIGTGKADTSRLLPLEVRPGDGMPDIGWPARLADELPRLFHRARAAYRELAVRPGQPAIVLTPAVQKLLEDASGVDVEADDVRLQQAGFVFQEGGVVPAGDVARCMGIDPTKPEWKDMLSRLEARGIERKKTEKGRFLVGLARAG